MKNLVILSDLPSLDLLPPSVSAMAEAVILTKNIRSGEYFVAKNLHGKEGPIKRESLPAFLVAPDRFNPST